MQLTGNITPDSLMTLEAYSKYRKEHKPQVIAHRKLRSVQLGENMNLQFESETTIRYQIQEMLRIEKIFEEDGILQEIERRAGRDGFRPGGRAGAPASLSSGVKAVRAWADSRLLQAGGRAQNRAAYSRHQCP